MSDFSEFAALVRKLGRALNTSTDEVIDFLSTFDKTKVVQTDELHVEKVDIAKPVGAVEPAHAQSPTEDRMLSFVAAQPRGFEFCSIEAINAISEPMPQNRGAWARFTNICKRISIVEPLASAQGRQKYATINGVQYPRFVVSGAGRPQMLKYIPKDRQIASSRLYEKKRG